jgi:adenylyltransferase/sulfurtransferase
MGMIDDDLPRLSHSNDYQRYGRQMILDGFGLEGAPK